MALPQQCRVAELTARGCTCIFRIHSLPNELLRQQLKMRLHLPVKFGVRLFPSEKTAYSGHKSKNRGSHGHFSASKRKTRPITPEIRSQFSVSIASCVRPRLVIE